MLAINPVWFSWQTNVQSLLRDIVSLESPTVPCQRPTTALEKSAAETGRESFVQATNEATKAMTASARPRAVLLCFWQKAFLMLIGEALYRQPVFEPLRR